MPQFCLSFEALTSLLASTLNFSKLAAQIPIVHWGLNYTQIIISLVSWFLASGLWFKLFIHPIMTLVCSGMLGIDSGCDLLSFWHGGQVASEANFGLWPLLMSLLEYFRICTQSFRKYAISNQFWPLGVAPALYHYFRFSECVRFSMITIPLLTDKGYIPTA